MAETPFQLLVVKIAGLMGASRWRLGYSAALVQRETGHTGEEVERAIPLAMRMARRDLGGQVGPDSLRAELNLFSKFVRAEARARKVEVLDGDVDRWKSDADACSEAVREAFRLLGGEETGDLRADVVALTTRAEQRLEQGNELDPDALRALWRVAGKGAALEWAAHRSDRIPASR
jgi:hypothetical protein